MVSSRGLEGEGRREEEWRADIRSWYVLYRIRVPRLEIVIGCHSLVLETLRKGEESGVGLFRGSAPVLFLRGGGRGDSGS